MPLVPGTRLGPYEIAALLGVGGMGEVYRARDTRLERSVAVKVLSSHLADDPDRRARFEREAKAVSSLNHPHICTLHDVGSQDGTDYIVMELVEGATLAARLTKGPLPIEQALRHGVEIADALDKAHRQGVIHRDLKPGNVMLTKAGTKLMDFGLARRAFASVGGGADSLSPTDLAPLTGHGVLLGTLPYMAPEQLEGKEADARSDLWALACVLYEMATGTRAFDGKSQASLISAIMTAEPRPIAELQPLTPPSLERLVKACLAKDPEDRLQTAHDVRQELEWITESPLGPVGSVGGAAAGSSGASWSRSVLTAGVALLVGSVLGGLAVRLSAIGHPATATPGAICATIPLKEVPTESSQFPAFCISPDGRLVVVRADGRLVLRALSDFSWHPSRAPPTLDSRSSLQTAPRWPSCRATASGAWPSPEAPPSTSPR